MVICPARSLEGMRVPREWRGPLAEGRLLLLSPFTEKSRRVTSGLAAARNKFVAAALFNDAVRGALQLDRPRPAPSHKANAKGAAKLLSAKTKWIAGFKMNDWHRS